MQRNGRYFIGFLIPTLLLVIWMSVLDIHGVFTGNSVSYGPMLRLQRPYAVLHWKSKNILLGTSTVRAIDTTHPAFATLPGFIRINAGGASMYETLRILQHAEKAQPLDTVILGIDYPYMLWEPVVKEGFSEKRFLTTPDGSPKPLPLFLLGSIEDAYANIFARQTLRVALQYMRPVRDRPEKIRKDTVIPYELEGEKSFIQAHLIKDRNCTPDPQLETQSLHAFKDLVHTLRNNDMRAYLFLSPHHAYRMETFFRTECKDTFLRHLKTITEIAADEPLIELWDFSIPSSVTAESFDWDAKDGYVLRRYRDLKHYNNTIGNFVIDRMFDYKHFDRTVPQDFGTRLTMDTIDAYLRYYEEQIDWYKRHRQAEGEFRPEEL